MECINCKVSLSKMCYNEICVKCRFDNTVMISKTDIIQHYKLSQSDLDKAKLFYVEFTIHNNIGRRYLRSDIHNLAQKLSADLPNNDVRKTAFQNMIDEVNKTKCMKIKKDNIMVNVTFLLQKYDIQNINIDLKNIIEQFVNKQLSDDILSETLLCINICDKIWDFLNRKKLLDKKIEQHYGQYYVNFIQSNKEYNNHVLSLNMSLDSCFYNIKSIIEKHILVAKRKTIIDEFIKKHYNEQYIIQLTQECEYQKFIDCGGDINVIKKVFDKFVAREIRIKELTNALEKVISKKHINKSKNHVQYLQYIDNGGNIIKTVESIKQYYNKFDDVEKRKKEINKLININPPTELTQYICNKYTLHKSVTLEKVVDMLKNKEVYIKREQELLNSISRHLFITKKSIIDLHPKYFRFLEDLTLDIDDLVKEINFDINFMIGKEALGRISDTNIRQLNKTLYDFHNSCESNMDFHCTPWLTYATYMCNQYGFNIVNKGKQYEIRKKNK